MAFQVSQDNCCRFSRLGDLVQYRPDIGRPTAESPGHIPLVGDPKVVFDALDHDRRLL